MAKTNILEVKDSSIRTLKVNGEDYISITDIAKQKNPAEPKDVVKNWMRLKNTLEYLGLWENLNNSAFKGVEFDPLLKDAGNNSFTMSPTRWVELTGAIGLMTKNGAGGGTYAQRDIAFNCTWLKNFNASKKKNKSSWAGLLNENWQSSITIFIQIPSSKI